MKHLTLILFMLLILSHLGFIAYAIELHVSPRGDNNSKGTISKPLQTLQAACDRVQPGDTIIVHKGIYRESVELTTSGKPNNPISIIAAKNEQAVIDGTDPVNTSWRAKSNGIFTASVDSPVEQVFIHDEMLVEARWPNMRFPEQLWERDCWASASEGSDKGLMVDPSLSKSGLDLTGAMAMLNISHQFWTWTCPVTSKGAENDRFRYDTSKSTGMKDATNYIRYNDDYYYLFGIRSALDAPGEWHYDDNGTLRLIPPEGQPVEARSVRIKRRDFGLTLRGVSHVEVQDLSFFGCTFRIVKGHDNRISNCHARFPSYSRSIVEREGMTSPCTSIAGDRNHIERCSLGFASGTGLSVHGDGNVIDNNLIHDVCWSGSLDYGAIRVSGSDNTVSRNTVFNSGNILLTHGNGTNVIELNHVYYGGRACRDVSLVYSVTPKAAKSIVRYNWVHGCFAPHLAMGIRGDDKSRDLIFHHNVIWACDWEGLVVKGDRHRVFHNTAFDNGRSDILLYVGPEKDKDWQKQWKALSDQNKNSLIYNNAVQSMAGNRQHPEIPPGGDRKGNYEADDIKHHLNNPGRFDFRPKPDSPLIDYGQAIPDTELEFQGKAPDAGAYELGGEYWIPGITWQPKEVIGFEPVGYLHTHIGKKTKKEANKNLGLQFAENPPIQVISRTPPPPEPITDTFEIRDGFTLIKTLDDFRNAIKKDNQKIRMKPGIYRAQKVDPPMMAPVQRSDQMNRQEHIFAVNGSNNYFDLRGVVFETPVSVQSKLTGKAHVADVWHINGSDNTFEGGYFRNILDRDYPHYRVAENEFEVCNDNNTFLNCTFVITGSIPYGYSDFYGKGGPNFGRLNKHSFMSIHHANNTKLIGCKVYLKSFGHCVHFHTADGVLIKDCFFTGTLRPTNDIYKEKVGRAVEYDFNIMYRGKRPIPRDQMIPLTEDGIRSYDHVKNIKVIDTTIERMRGCFQIWSGVEGDVILENVKVLEAGKYAYDITAGHKGKVIMENCSSDVAYDPIFNLTRGEVPYKGHYELTILNPPEGSTPTDRTSLGAISGDHCTFVIHDGTTQPLTKDVYYLKAGQKLRGWKGLTNSTVINYTEAKIILDEHVKHCVIKSAGLVEDHGEQNEIIKIEPKKVNETK